jgi:NAD(P)-dependent dehydrogenase (short-subunit alcohol dehydrogenase family)
VNHFEGRIALVTGSTQGLGQATAELLARRGIAGIAICGRNREKGNAVAESITEETGCPVLYVQTDMGSIHDCERFVDKAGERFGRIDIFASCAGTTRRGWIGDTTQEIWDDVFAVNVRGPFFMIQRAVPWMRRNALSPGSARGWIASVVSISAHGGQPFLVPYAASKGALQTVLKNAAYGLLKDRIRVNGLNIGWANTPHEHDIQQEYHNRKPNWLEQAAPLQPFGRLIEPEDVARALAFLASDESGIMTGSVIDYDQTVVGCRLAKPGETLIEGEDNLDVVDTGEP